MLKITIRLILALALVAFASSNSSAATQTANLGVTASVSAGCTISAGTVAFGAYDPVVTNASSGADKTGTGIVTVDCTNGSATTVTLGQGANPGAGSTDAAPLRRMNDGSANYISYSLYQDAAFVNPWGNTPATGEPYTGTGTSSDLTVYGVALKGQNVPVGSYSDTVIATITF